MQRKEQGIYTEGFFNLMGDNIYKSQVVKDIDSDLGLSSVLSLHTLDGNNKEKQSPMRRKKKKPKQGFRK